MKEKSRNTHDNDDNETRNNYNRSFMLTACHSF